MQKTNQEEFRIEKGIKRKEDKLFVKWKGYDNSFNSCLDQKTLYKSSQNFPNPYELFYSTKTDLKKVTGVDASNLAAKSELASLKAKVDKIDVDNLRTVPVDLSKLSNVVNNGVVRKPLYDKLVAKVNNIDTSEFVLKTKYDTDESDLEKKISDADKKIPSISGLDYNAKITK